MEREAKLKHQIERIEYWRGLLRRCQGEKARTEYRQLIAAAERSVRELSCG